MTMLGCEKTQYKKKLILIFPLIAAASVAVIVLNVLLTMFRTDATHIAFVTINIVFDIAAVWGIYAVTITKILPMKRLLSLYERSEKIGKKQHGTVLYISEKTVCVQGFQCFRISFETDTAQSDLYLIENGISLENGKAYTVSTVENLICSAEEIL